MHLQHPGDKPTLDYICLLLQLQQRRKGGTTLSLHEVSLEGTTPRGGLGFCVDCRVRIHSSLTLLLIDTTMRQWR